MRIISVKESPEYKDRAIKYFQSKWANESSLLVYEECISNCITSPNPLPQWYLIEKEGLIIGGAGLITNDFISRMDLYPWVCAVYVEEAYRGNEYGLLLLNRAKEDTIKGGFSSLYLCTNHIGYYEKYGFTYIGNGHHPWGESSRIYESKLMDCREDGYRTLHTVTKK